MNNILLITKREFLTQVKKKSFIILTVLAPLMLAGFGAIIGLMFKANETHNTIQIVDKSGIVKNNMKSETDITYIPLETNQENGKVEELKKSKDINGILIIPELIGKNYDQLLQNSRLITNTKIGFDTKQNIASNLTEVIRKEKIRELGITEKQIKNIDKKFELKTIDINDNNKENSDLSFGVKSGLSMILMYATFMFILIYGVRVMRSVLEEKNNRVVEILISSVKPFELMLGKILGVTFVALTQFTIWIAMSAITALFFTTSFGNLSKNMPKETTEMTDKMDFMKIAADVSQNLLDLNIPLIIIVFILFFLLGYIFYSSMYAAIGSAVDNETETQQFSLFAMIPMMLGVYGSISIMNNPDGPMAFWLSIIPFTSPITMVARIPFGVPTWQIILSLVLLILTTVFMIFVAGKIYRVGILMYGNKATLKEVWKWIRN